MLAALLLGALAGTLTTVTGLGGGQLLLVGLAAVWDPMTALTVTGPALLVGNMHRLAMFREHLQWRVVGPYVAGALPGSVLGGLIAVQLPETALHAIMVGMAALAGARLLFGWEVSAPPRLLAPGGAVVGGLAATGGGAGLLAGPMLLSAGLTGPAYIAAGSAGAIALHVGRMAAYGASGWVTGSTIATGLCIAVAVMAGNAVGRWIRPRVPDRWGPRLEVGAVGVCLALAVVA
ncbi:MAG: TSUP family transporter [Myxococcota bacterium]